MPTAQWQAAKLYLPGALVQPTTPPVGGLPVLQNPGFEDGNLDGWTVEQHGTGTAAASTGRPYSGAYAANWTGASGGGGAGGGTFVFLKNDEIANVVPGQILTAFANIAQDDTNDSANFGSIRIRWFNAADVMVGESEGNIIAGNFSSYAFSSVTASAPADAVKAQLVIWLNANDEGGMWADNAGWTTNTPPIPAGLIYKAVQPAAGVSAASEPVWPLTLGVQVIDNEVIWEAIAATRIEWKASPILKSGATEPTWPDGIGGFVADNIMAWEAISRRVEDVKCPNSKVVAIMASKVFAGDRDITPYSATANPLDWSSADDAGYLPTGLQQSNANDLAVLQPYRANLIAMNASCLQNWQVDPDPEQMAILDQMEGVGSIWQKAAQSVANELFYLSALGFRTVGIAAGAENLAAGDIGMPIDPLVREAIQAALASASIKVTSTYYPSQGQYWGSFANYPETDVSTVFVCTMNGGKGKWSRYVFPFAIEAFAQKGNDLYIRNGNQVSRISEDVYSDETEGSEGSAVEFPGTVWWPWLDMGTPGVTKRMEGFDIVSTGLPSVSIGYDQRNLAMFTDPYEVDPDTMPGGIIAMPVSAPTFSVRVDFEPGAPWRLDAFNIFLADNRAGT